MYRQNVQRRIFTSSCFHLILSSQANLSHRHLTQQVLNTGSRIIIKTQDPNCEAKSEYHVVDLTHNSEIISFCQKEKNSSCQREEYNIAKLSNLANTANYQSTTLGIWLSHGDLLFTEISQLKNKQTFPLNYCDIIHMAVEGFLQPLRENLWKI